MSRMKLYEIDDAIMALVDPESGEITDFDALDKLQMERDKKIESIALLYKNQTAEAEAIMNEYRVLAKRATAAKKRAEGTAAYLESILHGQAFKTAKCSIKFRRSSRVEITNLGDVCNFLCASGRGDLVKMAQPDVNKNDIANLLKIGVEIPGAAIIEHLNMGVE